MKIVFAGICCWVDAKPPKAGKTVIIPNATRGGTHLGALIPAHNAFIHAKQGQIESADWSPRITVDDNLVFLLEGDSITFDPVPGGGSIDIHDLPHVKDRSTNAPICAAADELRPGFRDTPDAFNVLGLVDLPPDSPVSTSSNGFGAMFATLQMPDGPVTITAASLTNPGTTRKLKVTDPNASVFIANVTLMDYLLGNRARDDDHQYLVCEMFRPSSTSSDASDPESGLSMSTNLSGQETKPIDTRAFREIRGVPGQAMEDFLSTFAAGCSNSQWQ